jgi:glycosyltransferase involved in cell wall biosynthesis
VRIVIATTCLPFNDCGADKIVDDLHRELRARDFNVDVVRIPFQSAWTAIPRQTLALRLFDLSECGDRIDRLITVRAPSYALRHPNKVAWFLQHHREAYDLWGTDCGMPDSDEARRYRDMMHHSDDLYLRECKKVFTSSRTVADRLERYNSFQPEGVLYPPLSTNAPFRAGEFGDYFFYPSNLAPIKRQELAIEAMKYTQPEVRLVIAGASESPECYNRLEERIRSERLEGRVQMLGWISEERKAELMSGCRAALFLPFQEDYGYVALEAFQSAKPVVTLSDSGGCLELVKDGVNGLVVPPYPRILAEAMNRLWADPDLARRLGDEALRTPHLRRIGWDYVIESLTA